MKNINYILFDAANTLIYKPALYNKIAEVLKRFQINVSLHKLQYHHKIISEITDFPDRTSKDFYAKFNSEMLQSLGIIPSDELLDELFSNCSYLPWEKFDDTSILDEIDIPLGVISNFNNSLPKVLGELFGDIFTDIIVSECINKRKPSCDFYQYAIDNIGLPVNQILYIGDSLKLDIIPAKRLGMNVLLIDRLKVFGSSEYAIDSFAEVKRLLNSTK